MNKSQSPQFNNSANKSSSANPSELSDKKKIQSLKLALERSRSAISRLNERNEILKASLFDARQKLIDFKTSKKTPPSSKSKTPQSNRVSDSSEAIACKSSVSEQLLDFKPTMVISGSNPWCSFGVRDPFFLLDESGTLAKHEGFYIMFFSGRDQPLSSGGKTSIGIARSSNLIDWQVDTKPAFEDGAYAASGGAIIMMDGSIRLFYSFDTARGFRIAETKDLKHWNISYKTFADPRQFHCKRIGLPHIFKHGETWYALFEGLRKHFNIYGMSSPDGMTWTPLHNGEPIYSPSLGAWDQLGQANPSVANVNNSMYLLYNGYKKSGDWDIGIRPFFDPKLPIEHSGEQPLISREDLRQLGIEAGRLEGVRIFSNILEGRDHFFFFSLPSLDSYENGVIWHWDISHTSASDLFKSSSVTTSGKEKINLQSHYIDIRDSVKNQDLSFQEKDQTNLQAEETFNDTFSDIYFKIWDNNPIQQITKQFEENLIRRLVKSSDNVLLVGSGGGREIECLLEIGAKPTALDISRKMLEIGANRYPSDNIDWIQGDAQRPPNSLKNFDHILALGLVFCYLPNPELALANLRDSLKVGGHITISFVNGNHFTESNERKYLDSGRVRFPFTIEEFKRMLLNSGYITTSVNGSRFFIDGLPREWNDPNLADGFQSRLINNFGEMELELSDKLNPELAKQLIITARAI